MGCIYINICMKVAAKTHELCFPFLQDLLLEHLSDQYSNSLLNKNREIDTAEKWKAADRWVCQIWHSIWWNTLSIWVGISLSGRDFLGHSYFYVRCQQIGPGFKPSREWQVAFARTSYKYRRFFQYWEDYSWMGITRDWIKIQTARSAAAFRICSDSACLDNIAQHHSLHQHCTCDMDI